MTPRNRSRGFTLIEVVVAFAIFALTAGALFELFAGAARRGGEASDIEGDWLVAQTLLAEARARSTSWDAERTGRTEDGHTWRITAVPFDAGSDPNSRWLAYDITVRVSSDGNSNRAAELRSVELGWVAP